MNLTRNTHLYKIKTVINKKKQDVYYRDLNTMEYTFLMNIKNIGVRDDLAGRTVIFQMDPDVVPFGTRITIGQDALSRVTNFINDKRLFEIAINESRDNIKNDDFLVAIKSILQILPGQSYTDLLKLTLTDLIELICLCESMIGKPLFDIGNTRKGGLVNTKNLPDDGKSLQEKMAQLNAHLGTK